MDLSEGLHVNGDVRNLFRINKYDKNFRLRIRK